MQKYFNRIIGDQPIRVDYEEKYKGKAVYSTMFCESGETIFTEKPFVAMQHLDDKDINPCCAQCFRFVGTSMEHLNKILRDNVVTIPMESPPFPNYDSVPEGVSCECGEIYCSEECKLLASSTFHRLVCPLDSSSPWVEFYEHANVTNEIFALAARVVATIICKFLEHKDFENAMEPVDMFCKMPWWEVVATTAEIEEGQTIDVYKDIFRGLLEESLNLMHAAMLHSITESYGIDVTLLVEKQCSSIFTLNVYAMIVGMFELNNISLEVPHPLRDWCEEINSLEGPLRQELIDQLLPFIRLIQGVDVEDKSHFSTDIFPALSGTALFSLVCTMNHNCDPNCSVNYDTDGTAYVIALRDIRVGDELCISYIDSDQDFQQRQEELREYQFECRCDTCIKESEELIETETNE